MNKILSKIWKFNPAKILAFGFLIYAIAGVILISLPIAQKHDICFIDNLFNVVSAMSTTGLSTASIPEIYTTFGELILLALIQLGGLGYMTLTSFIILSCGKKLGNERIKILSAEFPLPQNFDKKSFIKHIVIFTFIIEFIGTIILWIQFKQAGINHAFYNAFFHAISSFCTAGFSTFHDGLIQFKGNVSVNLTISILSYLGAIGFIIPSDIYRRLKKETNEITFTTKVILSMTFLIITIGTALFYFIEKTSLLEAFFQIVSASSTTGFNTIPLNNISTAALLVMIIAMVIGASPSGTGGGLKTTTLSAMLGVTSSVIHGNPENITFCGRTIPPHRVMTALATCSMYIIFLIITIFGLCLVDHHSFIELCFEATSALGTVGLSTGITSELTTAAKLILTVAMYLGRLGALTLGIAFFYAPENIVNKKSDLAV